MPETSSSFLQAFNGTFFGVLRWPQLDELWETLRDSNASWYIYALGEAVPAKTVSDDEFRQFITEIDELLRRDHDEDYCGIVYVDDFSQPAMVKIFDPNNLGSVCGSSGKRTLPGWVVSKLPPVDIAEALTPPNNRRRWWQRLFPHEKRVA